MWFDLGTWIDLSHLPYMPQEEAHQLPAAFRPNVIHVRSLVACVNKRLIIAKSSPITTLLKGATNMGTLPVLTHQDYNTVGLID